MKSKEQKWIEFGYTLFAKEGPKGLKVDRMAKTLGTGRSSFYYHFADLEIFTSCLLEHHIERAQIICEAALQCDVMNPDLLNAIIEFKEDLLFHRQLRIHREVPDFDKCIEKAHNTIEMAFLNIWAREMQLQNNLPTAKVLLRLVSENFYMKISEDNLNFKWLANYLREIVEMTRGIGK